MSSDQETKILHDVQAQDFRKLLSHMPRIASTRVPFRSVTAVSLLDFQVPNCCSTTRFSGIVSSWKSTQLKSLNVKLTESSFKSVGLNIELHLACETMGCCFFQNIQQQQF